MKKPKPQQKAASRRQLGRRIAALLEEHGISQVSLADTVGVERSSVAHWVRGDTAPGINVLPLVADALHTSVDALLAPSKAA